MENINYIFLFSLFLGVTLACLTLIIKILNKKPDWIISSILIILSSGVILRNIYQRPRINTLTGVVDFVAKASYSGTEVWVRVSQLTTFIFVFFCMLSLIYGLLMRESVHKRSDLYILLTGLGFYASLILSAIISSDKDFHYGLFLFPLFMISVYLGPRQSFQNQINVIKFSLLLFIYGSLLALILNPGWATSQENFSVIGLYFRLSGVTAGANGLGYISAAAIMISVIDFRKKTNIINIIASLATLVLSQSKTAWIAILIWALIMIWLRLSHKKKALSVISIVILTAGNLALIVLVLQGTLLQSVLSTDLSTLSGRASLWQISMNVWREYPIFGYGPNLWNLSFSQQSGQSWLVGQAHNQWIQTIASTGILGLITLIVYLFYVIKKSTSEISYNNYLPLSLTLLLIIRMTTETPLTNTVIDEGFLAQCIMFLVILNSSKLISKDLHKNSKREVDKCIQ